LAQDRVAEEFQALVMSDATVFVREGTVRQSQFEQLGFDLEL
jgi:hypothetical protein